MQYLPYEQISNPLVHIGMQHLYIEWEKMPMEELEYKLGTNVNKDKEAWT